MLYKPLKLFDRNHFTSGIPLKFANTICPAVFLVLTKNKKSVKARKNGHFTDSVKPDIVYFFLTFTVTVFVTPPA